MGIEVYDQELSDEYARARRQGNAKRIEAKVFAEWRIANGCELPGDRDLIADWLAADQEGE